MSGKDGEAEESAASRWLRTATLRERYVVKGDSLDIEAARRLARNMLGAGIAKFIADHGPVEVEVVHWEVPRTGDRLEREWTARIRAPKDNIWWRHGQPDEGHDE